MVISAVGVRIVNNSFHNGFGHPTNSILFLDGGCGAYEDYTEGPFSADILIAGNTFTTNAEGGAALGVGAQAAIQLAGCRPVITFYRIFWFGTPLVVLCGKLL
jgi:hypothetical protein